MPQFLQNIYPRDNGASDWGDSSRLAGLMALINHPQTPPLEDYIILHNNEYLGVRVPVEDPNNPGSNNPLNFTRDQTLPLMAGLHKQNKIDAAKKLYFSIKNRGFRAQNVEHWLPGSKKSFPDGPDLFSPSARLAVTLAANEKPSLLLKIAGNLFFYLDILWASLQKDDFEINQTIAVAYLLGKLHLIRKIKNFEVKIRNYWCGWRNEPEIAEGLIYLVEKV